MEIKKVVFMYFSPTQSSKNVLSIMKSETNLETEDFDLTDLPAESTTYSFDESTLVVLGTPVYSGRVPKTAIDRFAKLNGNNTPIALITTYGNRDYDDALLELKTIIEEKGFRTIGAAAIVTEHSIVHSIGQGRPNAEDIIFIKNFTAKLFEKLDQLESISQLTPLHVKGNADYCTYHAIPIKPKSTDKCTACGLCAKKCPVGAIPSTTPNKTNTALCISCMRCIQVCPRGGKKLSGMEQLMAKKLIESKCVKGKLPEMFL